MDSTTINSEPQTSPRKWTRWDRLSLVAVLLPLVAAPFVMYSAISSWQKNNNDVSAWADDDMPVKKQFQAFADHFGRPELVMVSWPECREDSAKLQQLADRLSQDDFGDWFSNVLTTRTAVDQLQDIPHGLSVDEIKSQLQGILLGRDGKLACLVAQFGPAGIHQRPLAIDRIKELAAQIGIPTEDLRIGGIGAELGWLDYESVAAPARLSPIIGIFMLGLCVLFLRSIRLGLFVASLGVFTGFLSGAIIDWCGIQSNAVLATLPTLGGLLTVSLSLHFIAYYRSAAQECPDPSQWLRQAWTWAWKPTSISAVTTALGLGSLLLSRTLTIRQFGVFGAIITICAAVLTLTVLPAFLHLTALPVNASSGGIETSFWQRWVQFVQGRARLIAVTVVVVAAVVGIGLTNLRTGVHVDNLFVERHEIIQSDRWLEEYIGPLASVEIVVAFPRNVVPSSKQTNKSATLCASLIRIQSLTNQLKQTDRFRHVISSATGLPESQQTRGLRKAAARVQLRRWLNNHHDELLSSGLYTETETEQLWRISVRIPAFAGEATSEVCRELTDTIEAWSKTDQAKRRRHNSTLRYYVTGLPVLFEQIEQQFIEDLIITYIGGLILISLTVLLVLRSVKDAVTAMIPNVLPAVGVLGGLSLLGVELDVGSVMTASIALGVAVDDTLHFMLWYQQQRKTGLSSRNAVRSSIMHCGAPILQTSVICGVGLAVLGFASFLPTMRFGTLIALMLGVALIGDLLFLPAILSMRRDTQTPKET
jgi:predicted RND superfamily exporter protein